MQEDKLVYVLLAITVLVVFAGALGWFVLRQSRGESGTSVAPSTGVTPVEEATKETNKTVVGETRTASGQVQRAVEGRLLSIEGNTLVLDQDGDRVSLVVAPDAQITRTKFFVGTSKPPQREVIALTDLKINDQVSAFVEVKGDIATVSSVNVMVNTN